MNRLLSRHPAHFALAVIIAAFGAGCADDADRMERAQEYRENADYSAAIIELKNVLQADPKNVEARVLLGEVSLENGDVSTAIKELSRARELGGSPDQYAIVLARALLRESRFQEVASLNAELLTNIDDRAALLALIGTAKIGLGDNPAAESDFSAALKLVPDQPDALTGRAALARERGDLEVAEAGLIEALETRPDDPDSLAALAQLQNARGEFAKAEENFDKAMERLAGTSRVQERMSIMSGKLDALLEQGKIDQAQALGSRMIEMSPQHPMALFKAGRADYAAKNYAGTIEKAEQVIAAYPSATPPRMMLAAAAIASGDTALAAKHLQAAVNIDPGDETARKLLARVRMAMGDPAEALELLEPLMAAGTDDAQLLAMAGEANIRTGNQQEGLQLTERGMEVGGDDPALVLRAAAGFLASGEIDRAIEVLESLPEVERVSQRELLLVLALLRKGDTEAARARAVAAVEANPESFEAHRLMGAFYLAVGEFDQSRREFEKTMELNPGDTGALVNLARLDVGQQKPEQAVARFRQVLEDNPGDLMALTALAELAAGSGDTDASVDLLEQARAANPDSVEPLIRLGRHYLQAGSLQLAEERASQAVRVAEDNATTHTLLGQVLMQDGRHSEALGRFEKAIEVAPNQASPQYHLGRALAASGNTDGAIAAFERAAAMDGKFYPARLALTLAATERGDFNKAMGIIESLVADYPDQIEPLMLKGLVQIRREDLPAALEAYQKAAELRPSHEIAVKIYQVQKAMGAAEPWAQLEQWVSDHPDDSPARTMLAAAFMESGMDDRASEHFEQVMAVAPTAKVAMAVAEIVRSAGDLDKAAQWMKKAIEIDPKGLMARAELAGLELQRDNPDTAAKLLRDLRKDHPHAPELDVLEGNTKMALGDYKGSIAAFDRALEARPSEFLVLKRYQAGKGAGNEDAWQLLQKWFENHPGHVNVGLQLAQDYSGREWRDEAIEAYQKVLVVEPNNAHALNNLAWAYLERFDQGDFSLGLAAAVKAYGLKPELPAIADTYGWMLLKDGQNKRAVKLLKAAFDGSDDDPDIAYHYAAALEADGRRADSVDVLNRLLADNKSFDSRDDAEALRRRLSP